MFIFFRNLDDRFTPSCTVYITCGNYINYGINNSIQYTKKCAFALGHVVKVFELRLEKASSVSSCCDCTTVSGVGVLELKTPCPNWVGAGVVIGETLSLGVEIKLIIYV